MFSLMHKIKFLVAMETSALSSYKTESNVSILEIRIQRQYLSEHAKIITLLHILANFLFCLLRLLILKMCITVLIFIFVPFRTLSVTKAYCVEKK